MILVEHQHLLSGDCKQNYQNKWQAAYENMTLWSSVSKERDPHRVQNSVAFYKPFKTDYAHIFGASSSFPCKREGGGVSQQESRVKQEQAMVMTSQAADEKLIWI